MKIKHAIDILRRSGVPSPKEDARRIFSALGKIPEYALLSPDLSCDKLEVISAIERRSKREPLQYIIGEVDFYREKYLVSPDCLIPRSDTEILVDYAVKSIPSGAVFLDVCTGSGCVALSILNNTEKTRAAAIDISEAALSVARKNAERLSLSHRIGFQRKDALKEASKGDFFAVVSNPPYVSRDAYKNLEKEIYFEPAEAFIGGEDGADFYRILTPLYKEIIPQNGFIAYEIGYDQAKALENIAKLENMAIEIIKDLSGNDRVAVLRKK